MRSIAELVPIRATLSHALAWPLLQALRTEADAAEGMPFTRSIFELSRLADISPARISALLDELADADAIGYAPVNGDPRTLVIEVL